MLTDMVARVLLSPSLLVVGDRRHAARGVDGAGADPPDSSGSSAPGAQDCRSALWGVERDGVRPVRPPAAEVLLCMGERGPTPYGARGRASWQIIERVGEASSAGTGGVDARGLIRSRYACCTSSEATL